MTHVIDIIAKMALNYSMQTLSSGFCQQLDFFKGVPPILLKDLLQNSEAVQTNPKKIIFYSGEPADHFGFVIEGVYKIFQTDQLGRRVIMDFVSPGGMIAGLLMAEDDAVYPVTVQSINLGKFLKIPKSTYNEFWCKNAEIMKKVQIAIMQRVKSLQTLREAQRLPLEQRVAWVLVKLLGLSSENNYLKVYFSREDIADAIGVAPESIIRVFSQWMKDGLIENKNDGEFINLEEINKKFL